MARTATLLLFCACLLSACGGEDERGSAEPAWQHARVEGLSGASGLTILENVLLVCSGEGQRAIHVVERSALTPGGTVSARPLEVLLRDDLEVTGSGLLARRAYTLGDLWNASVDFQGIAAQRPGRVFIADRSYRVIYRGTLQRAVGGRFERIAIDFAFTIPGARRTSVDAADYRDMGPGLSGLFGVRGRRVEDLVVAERAHVRADGQDREFRIQLLDAFGAAANGRGEMGFLIGRVPEPGPPEVEGISFHDDRYLILRGGTRPSLAPLRRTGDLRVLDLEPELALPDVPGAGTWRGMVHAEDGTLFLISSGDPAIIAWRAQRARE
jgi:hypothetical protein